MNASEPQPDYCHDPIAHKSLVDRVQSGASSINIEPAVATLFYRRVPLREIRERSHEDATIPKILVWGALSIAYLSLFLVIFLAIESMGWTSLLYIPLGGILWSIIAGFVNSSSEFRYSLHVLSLFLVLALIYFAITSDPNTDVLVVIYAFSIWLHRLAHVIAVRYLGQFVLRSCFAFEMLSDHIQIVEDTRTD